MKITECLVHNSPCPQTGFRSTIAIQTINADSGLPSKMATSSKATRVTLFLNLHSVAFLTGPALFGEHQRNSERRLYIFITARSSNLSIRIFPRLIFKMDGPTSADDYHGKDP